MANENDEKTGIQPLEPAHYTELSPFAGLKTENAVADSVVATMEAEGLDWSVEKEPMFLKDGRQVPDRMAVLKRPGDEILGTAGKLFTPVQNVDAFGTLQPAIDKFGALIETAGALGKGDRVWMLLSLPVPKGSQVAADDEIMPYFLVSNAHTSERSQSLQARYTSIRVCCQNTLEAAQMQDRAAVSIPHHKNATDRLKEIEHVVETMYTAHDNSIKLYKRMSKIKITPQQMAEYLRLLFKLRDSEEDRRLTALISKKGANEVEERVSKVFESRAHCMWLLDNGKNTGRTVWGAYNAVTEYIDHVSILKKNGQLTKNGYATAAFGYGAYQKARALDLAIDLWLSAQ